jgi:hypothetical protein
VFIAASQEQLRVKTRPVARFYYPADQQLNIILREARVRRVQENLNQQH